MTRAETALRQHAYAAVTTALNRGELVRQPCEVCGIDGSGPRGRRSVDAHHDDYSRPLDVRWLCRSHHRLRHTELGWGAGQRTTARPCALTVHVAAALRDDVRRAAAAADLDVPAWHRRTLARAARIALRGTVTQ